MEAKIIAYVLIGIFLGPVASLAITPVFCLLRKIFYRNTDKKAHCVSCGLNYPLHEKGCICFKNML